MTFEKKRTWKTRNVGENKITIPSTFWNLGRLFLDLGDQEETSKISRLPKGSGDMDHMLSWRKVGLSLVVISSKI